MSCSILSWTYSSSIISSGRICLTIFNTVFLAFLRKPFLTASISKSNIFSIDVKNSGFNYTLYSFNEVKKILEERFNKKFDISTGNNLNDFVNIINSSEFCKVDFNVVYEEKLNYEPLKITDNLEKIQFFKCKSGDRQKEYDLIIIKNKMQEHFKSAIRKSIKRYIPANSVLWKIQYSGK